jgi:hypothetical protein
MQAVLGGGDGGGMKGAWARWSSRRPGRLGTGLARRCHRSAARPETAAAWRTKRREVGSTAEGVGPRLAGPKSSQVLASQGLRDTPLR